ncbi:hypothetical protein J7J18_03560 [bacterium]|nr:hypothetical protein [bacterium]
MASDSTGRVPYLAGRQVRPDPSTKSWFGTGASPKIRFSFLPGLMVNQEFLEKTKI